MKKQTCSCKPTDACPHALADIFFIPVRKAKPPIARQYECVVCGGPYPNCRCFENNE